MKVLILSGASSIHTIRWVNALSRRNIKVILVSQHYPIEEIDNNVKVYIFKNYGSLGYYLLINKVKKIIEIEKPDLINAHYASGYGTTARLLNFHPYILSVWGSDIYDFPYKSFLHRGLINKNLLAADIIASTGNNMANQIKEICNDIAVKDIYITPFGVDLDNYKNNYFKERGNKIVIGTVKALKCVYGIDILIKAYNRVLEMRPDLKNILYLRVTGSGPEKENIIKLIKNLNLKQFFRNITDCLFKDWEVKYTMYNNRISQPKYNETIYLSRLFGKQLYIIDNFSKNLKDYIREKNPATKPLYFIKKTKSFKLFPSRGYSNTFTGALDNYYNILDLKNVPRKDWRAHIKEFQLLKQKLEEYILKDYYNPEIPKEWLDARKKQRVKTNVVSVRANKLEGEVSCKIATNLLRDVYGKNCKFEPFILKLNEIYKNPGLFIYEEYENRDKLDKLFPATSKNNIKLITFSKKEFQIIETLNIHNLMSYNKFMEGNNAPFKRIVTANLISKLISKNNYLFNNSYKFAELSTEFQQTLDELNDYPIELWAIGKLYAYGLQNEPFLHVDNDTFIWSRFSNKIEMILSEAFPSQSAGIPAFFAFSNA